MIVDLHERLQERLPAWPASVALSRRAVVDLAASHGASERQLEDIALAISEAMSNAVLHAYAGRRPGVITLEAWAQRRSLVVTIRDEGIGMQPRADSPGLGLGLPLIAGLTEELAIEQAMPGVRLRMTFAIG